MKMPFSIRHRAERIMVALVMSVIVTYVAMFTASAALTIHALDFPHETARHHLA